MFKVRKKAGLRVRACELGKESALGEALIRSGKLVPLPDGTFEIATRETRGKGERAHAGDFVKLDAGGEPYPVARDYFLMCHRPLGGDDYEQIPCVLDAWTTKEPVCTELIYLIRERGLKIAEGDSFFSAPLWGTEETAEEDAVLIFYSVKRDEKGHIVNVDFNFVDAEEFSKTYEIVE